MKIIIDPGHGGHDSGALGPNGIRESDIVLAVTQKLGAKLETFLGWFISAVLF